jgi:hypothetical protein
MVMVQWSALARRQALLIERLETMARVECSTGVLNQDTAGRVQPLVEMPVATGP